MVPIVEETRVPKLVTPSAAFVEVKVIGAVKHVDAEQVRTRGWACNSPIEDILARVRVYNI